MEDIIYIDSIMYIVKNVEKRFFRVLRSITYTNKTDRHDITGTIVKRDAKHHNPLTLTMWLSPMYCSDSITFKLIIVRLKCWNVAFETTKFTWYVYVKAETNCDATLQCEDDGGTPSCGPFKIKKFIG
jgi:hypothetical protein